MMPRTARFWLLSFGTASILGGTVGGTTLGRAQATPTVGTSPTSAAIDADVWTAVAATVVRADIVAMGRTYHPAAVVVTAKGTKPIAATLVGWGEGMAQAKREGTRAEVAFRFAKRQDDAETAFEAGIFKYTTIGKSGSRQSSYVRFESLLVKTNGKWQTLMERQLDAATESDWNALRR